MSNNLQILLDEVIKEYGENKGYKKTKYYMVKI